MNLEEYKTAAEMAEEVSPEVKYFIYAYFDAELKKFNPPFVSDKDPAFMVDGIKNSIIKGSAKPDQFTGLDFCFIGTFELNTGVCETFEAPKHLVKLNDLFEKYGGVEDGKVA